MPFIIFVFTLIICLSAYIQSLYYCVSNSEWLATLVLHVFLAPLGIVHGFFVWFGESWF